MNRTIIALPVTLLILSGFAINQNLTKASDTVEIGLAEVSPLGEEGGYAVPASGCSEVPSGSGTWVDAHGNPCPPPTGTLDLRAFDINYSTNNITNTNQHNTSPKLITTGQEIGIGWRGDNNQQPTCFVSGPGANHAAGIVGNVNGGSFITVSAMESSLASSDWNVLSGGGRHRSDLQVTEPTAGQTAVFYIECIDNAGNTVSDSLVVQNTDTPPTECNDGQPQGDDGVQDALDPGCWTDPTDPNTYDPNDDDETDFIVSLDANPNNGNAGLNSLLSWSLTGDTPDTCLGTSDSSYNNWNGNSKSVSGGSEMVNGIPVTMTFYIDCDSPTHTSGASALVTINAAVTECNDNVDNTDPEDDLAPVGDGSQLADENDPGCHTDGDASNPTSYDPNDNDERDPAGPVSGSVDLFVSGQTPPYSVSFNSPVDLDWNINNVTNCYGTSAPDSSRWNANIGTSAGPDTTGSLTGATVFTLTCQDPNGNSIQDSETVNVTSAPVLDFSINFDASPKTGLTPGSNTNLSWTIIGDQPDTCVAQNNAGLTTWDNTTSVGTVPNTAYSSPQTVFTNTTFSLYCQINDDGTGNPVNRNASVSVATGALNGPYLTADKQLIKPGDTVILTANPGDYDDCYLSSNTGYSSVLAVGVDTNVAVNPTAQTTYTLSCSAPIAGSDSVTVNVLPNYQET